MPRSVSARAASVAIALFLPGLPLLVSAAAHASEPEPVGEATVCHDGSLPRQRTEVDADIDVAGFDSELGTLLEVQVPIQVVHLDTDAVFENTAQSSVTFEEHMSYQVTFTSPGGLASPDPVAGTIERVPSQTLAAFDGTLDFQGASAVAQPSTTRDASASPVTSTDPGVLAAFTVDSVAFHVASSIGETFTGGGGNVEAKINTFAAASVEVCYRYAVAAAPPATPTTTPIAPSAAPVYVSGTVVDAPAVLAFTGPARGWLAAAGAAVAAFGIALVASNRRRGRGAGPDPLDLGGIDA